MKYQSLEQIALEADVHPGIGMSRRERLERWAELLEGQPDRRLCAIEGTEFGGRRERDAKRADNSPLTVAFEDPVLRAEGLRSDRVGDAVEFFDLSHDEVHCRAENGTAGQASDFVVSWDGHRRPIGAGCARAHVRGVLRRVCDLNIPSAGLSPIPGDGASLLLA